MARTDRSTLNGTVLAQAQQTTAEVLVLEPNTNGVVIVPRGVLERPIVYVKHGDDLLLEGEGSTAVTVRGYFHADPPPVLIMPDGAQINPTLLRAFLPPDNLGAAGQSAVAHVSDLMGEVFVIRPGQPPVRLNPGDPIYATDTVQTGDGAHLSLLFADGTSRSMGDNELVTLQDFDTAIPATSADSSDTDISPAAFDIAPSKATTQFTIVYGEITIATQSGTARLNQRGETISVSNMDGKISETVVLGDSDLRHLYGDLTDTVTGTQKSDSGNVDDEAARLNEIDTAAGGGADTGGGAVPGLVSPFRLNLSELSEPPPGGLEPTAVPAFIVPPFASTAGESSSSDDNIDTTSVSTTVPSTAPIAVADNVLATEDQSTTILSATLLGNDTDPDGGRLTLASVGQPVNGTVSLDANGDVLFMPDADFNGQARFEYTAQDGNGGSATATVTVTVAAVNDAPVALPNSAATFGDTAMKILASALLANDTDTEGDTLGLVSVQNAVNGTVKLDAGGDVLFTPDAGFLGPASFEYTVSDGNGGISAATVSVQVVAPPVLSPDQISGLNLWLDGADATTLLDSDGDGALNRWTDKSEQNHEATAPSANQQPLPADGAAFDGKDDVLTIADAPDLNLADASAARTLSLVFTAGADITTRQVLYEEGGSVRGLNLFIENGQALVGGYNLNETVWGPFHIGGTIAPNTVNSLSMTFDAVAGTISGTLNGDSLGSVEGVGLLREHISDIGLGGMEEDSVFPDGAVMGDGFGFAGTIHEVAFFERALKEFEIDALNTYYEDKWSVDATATGAPPADAATDNTFGGGPGDDTIFVVDGRDLISGGDGNDLFIAEDTGFGHIDGGDGFDTLILRGDGAQFDLRGLPDGQLKNFEAIEFSGSSDNVLDLNESVALTASGDSRVLRIDGDRGDTVNVDGDWSPVGEISDDGAGYTVFVSDTNNATLQVDNTLVMNIG